MWLVLEDERKENEKDICLGLTERERWAQTMSLVLYLHPLSFSNIYKI